MGRRTTRKKGQKKMDFSCSIPVRAHVQNSSYEPGDNFYLWVNNPWLNSTKIPSFENDYGVSEEVERCISDKSWEILTTACNSKMINQLVHSCMNNRSQHTSVEFLQSLINHVNCVRDVADVVSMYATLATARIESIFSIESLVLDSTNHFLLRSDTPSIKDSLYNDHSKMERYKTLLKRAGDMFGITELDSIYDFERNLVLMHNRLFDDTNHKIKGGKLKSKFHLFPWDSWFSKIPLPDWKSKTIYYCSPRWIRYLGKVLHEVPIEFWKKSLLRSVIIHGIQYLPSPYDDLYYEFFGKVVQGQEAKVPKKELCIRTVHTHLPDIFSEIFWEEAGDESLVPEIKAFTKTLVKSAEHRIFNTEWLNPVTRVKAVRKVRKMKIQTVRPEIWPSVKEIELDDKNFLKNIYSLGEFNIKNLIGRLGKYANAWEEGIYCVNAFYYSENNEIVIPYGTIINPFYTRSESLIGWNYGALGSIIGHEMCHGFDEDGKDFDENGHEKRWWTPTDNRHYKMKTRALIELFGSQKVLTKYVDGYKTLSENIADLGGISISINALKEFLNSNPSINKKEAYRNFFIAFATSWRTKLNDRKLNSSITMNVHAPAYLRVNLIVSQIDEWYEAFDITPENSLYIAPENRITIF
jgi:putative endopeptidase